MATSNEEMQLKILEQIKRLQMLSLSQQGVEGKRIAAVIGMDASDVSRILSGKKAKK